MLLSESGLAAIPGISRWDAVMFEGRVCKCGHTEVCHWNGENRSGAERFDTSCLMCSICRDFRDSGHRRVSQPAAPVYDLEPELVEEDVELGEELRVA